MMRKKARGEEHGGKGEETEKQNKNLSVSGIYLLTETLLSPVQNRELDSRHNESIGPT